MKAISNNTLSMDHYAVMVEDYADFIQAEAKMKRSRDEFKHEIQRHLNKLPEEIRKFVKVDFKLPSKSLILGNR